MTTEKTAGALPYKQLEKEFSDFTGKRETAVCNSGTSALTLALAGLGVGYGDEVIVPEFTMIATAWAVTYRGAKVVPVDCGDDLNIDPDKINITNKTKAVIVTHVYGRPVPKIDVPVPVIEDACEAHGAKVGWGYAQCYSFYRNKIIPAEEGGAVTSNDISYIQRLRDLRSMAFGSRHDYYHRELGYNFRMPNAQAKMVLDSIEKIDEILEKRKQIQSWYDEHFKQYTIDRPEGSVLWVYDMLVDEDKRDKILELVDGARPFFKPMSMQPMYRGKFEHLKAYDFSKRGLYLPVRNDMTRDEVEHIAQTVKSVL